MNSSSEEPHFSPTTVTTKTAVTATAAAAATTTIQFETVVVDDWDKPLSNEELDAIEAAFEAATPTVTIKSSSSTSSSIKTPRNSSSANEEYDSNAGPKSRRRLFETVVDDVWYKPLSNEELEAIEAAFEAATSTVTIKSSSSTSSSIKTPRSSSSANEENDSNARLKTRRRLFETVVDDVWHKPFSNEELEAIEAVFETATSTVTIKSSSSTSSSIKTPRSSSYANEEDDSNARSKTRRRLPGSISYSNGEPSSPQNSRSFALTPCYGSRNFRQGNVKMEYPAMNFGGRIVYSRTAEEVEEATLQILKMLEARKRETGRAVIGLDIEWKPSFVRGIPHGKAAVMQICGDMTHCYVLHIIHSGIPSSLQSLLEDSEFIKVGVGIDNDAVKVFRDHNVSIKAVEDLSILANQKLGGVPKQWSLSSLVETFTCKQLLKPKNIRLGNWEADFLSKPQLEYAATDAFASWNLCEVLKSYADLPQNKPEN